MYEITINRGTEGNDYQHYKSTGSKLILDVYTEQLTKDRIDFEVLKDGVKMPKE
jgi:hypothetical protein